MQTTDELKIDNLNLVEENKQLREDLKKVTDSRDWNSGHRLQCLDHLKDKTHEEEICQAKLAHKTDTCNIYRNINKEKMEICENKLTNLLTDHEQEMQELGQQRIQLCLNLKTVDEDHAWSNGSFMFYYYFNNHNKPNGVSGSMKIHGGQPNSFKQTCTWVNYMFSSKNVKDFKN